MIASWFPQNYELRDYLVLKKLLFASHDWQIFSCYFEQNCLIVNEKLADYWFDLGINKGFFEKISVDFKTYYFVYSDKDIPIIPVCSPDSIHAIKKYLKFEDALSFAKAISNTRKLGIKDSLENAIYVEKLSLVLPVPHDNNKADDKTVLASYMSGGVRVSADNDSIIRELMINVSKEEYEEIFKAAEIDLTLSKVRTKNKKLSNEDKAEINSEKKEFSLPGRKELESFFKDYVIDVVENSEYYIRMGIEFPSPFILQGPPGCGKTYAVEKLTEYLDWPCFYIDSSTVGSSFIHESSKKISKVFDDAVDAAPSVIVIDEMESFLSNRESTHTHHLEEVGEFLRRIPEAKDNKVLVIAMTNMISSIDSAIRRKGRFDHIIEVGMPSSEEIEMVINHFLDPLPHSEIDSKKLSKELENSSMADVDFVLRESARLTAKEHLDNISQETIDKVIKSYKSKSEKNKKTPGFRVNKD
jgi:SpoVK/Ycf46/Vps4 family AAA+-type ATPase